MSTPDPTPLAQRLLNAVIEAEEQYADSVEATPRASWDLSLIVRSRQKIDVVAVLRELAEGLPPAWSGLPDRLRALADSIEKGGTDDEH